MARFYGTMQGQRGGASQLGSATSGLTAHIRGWNVGVRVVGTVDADNHDVIEAYETAGNNGGPADRLIARLRV